MRALPNRVRGANWCPGRHAGELQELSSRALAGANAAERGVGAAEKGEQEQE